ncbi:hypothetical protein ACYOEI_24165, partial [Singulisphaera rosea]
PRDEGVHAMRVIVRRIGARRRPVALAVVACACGALLMNGCGSSGPAQDLSKTYSAVKDVDPKSLKKKRSDGRGLQDVSIQERRQILREARKKQQDSP